MLCDCTALQMYLKKVVRPRGRTGQYQLPQTKPGYRANPLRLFCCESIDKIKTERPSLTVRVPVLRGGGSSLVVSRRRRQEEMRRGAGRRKEKKKNGLRPLLSSMYWSRTRCSTHRRKPRKRRRKNRRQVGKELLYFSIQLSTRKTMKRRKRTKKTKKRGAGGGRTLVPTTPCQSLHLSP